ncbi:MAG: hypothetical protein HRT87_05225 [Legionellales bacterium]|nr:hypothetical protein [Legionellales bacterium]
MKNIIRKAKKIIRLASWYSYYWFDRICCYPKQHEVLKTDLDIENNLREQLAGAETNIPIILYACFEKEYDDPYLIHFAQNNSKNIIIFINNTNKKKLGVSRISSNHIWVNRQNYMRDIGAYRLGINALYNLAIAKANEVILINDSIYILRKDMYEFFRAMDNSEVLCHSFSTNPHRHVRSYLFRINSNLIEQINIYLDSLPITRSRFAAVIHGEIGMSKHVLLRQEINLWKYRKINDLSKYIPEPDITEILQEEKLQNQISGILTKMLAENTNIKRTNNTLFDPYEISSTSSGFTPDIIKKEVFDKNLATEDKIIRVIQSSDIPIHIKPNIIRDILILKKHRGIKYRIKKAIGEI